MRAKPVPTYRRTLSQQYQRWLYEDYIYLWHQLSIAVKQAWNSQASRYKMTGFAYFMQDRLTRLPDIAGLWRLDEPGGALARDSSRNGNNGTIFGAQSVRGTIGRALSFDGLDDYVNCGVSDTLNLATTDFTILAFVTPSNVMGVGNVLSKWQNTIGGYSLSMVNDKTILFLKNTAHYLYSDANALIPNTLTAVCYRRQSNTLLECFINGVLQVAPPFGGLQADIGITTNPFYLIRGRYIPYKQAIIDQPAVYYRLLDETEIQRHADRRYSQ